LLAFFLIVGMSGSILYKYYVNTDYETWRWKTNPKFPTPENVRSEVLQMIKGMATASLAPSLALYLSNQGRTMGYCGSGGYSFAYNFFTFLVVWIASDFWEFYYHRLGHTTIIGWKQHKYHHLFYNPSPFAVIADEYIDQFFRSLPMLLFPALMPCNLDMVFFTYAIFFYCYGTYLHWGFEFNYPDAHIQFMKTAFLHYLLHAKSVNKRPYHTGFFFRIWDDLFGSVWKGECFCAKCEQKAGRRSKEHFNKVVQYDYSPLLTFGFWKEGILSVYESTKEVREKLNEFNKELRNHE
jgi:lathosterol oxidase